MKKSAKDQPADVPLLRYGYVAATLAELERVNLNTTPAACRARLPLLVDDPRTLIPKRPYFRFLEEVWNPDVALAGLDAGITTATSGDARWILDSACTPETTLLAGLRALLRQLQGEANETPMGLELHPGGAMLWHRGLEQPRDGSRPGLAVIELVPCGVFLAFVQRFLGGHWQPQVIYTQAWRAPSALRERLPRTRFQGGRPCLSIWIEEHELLMPLRRPSAPKQRDLRPGPVPTDLVPGLKAALTAYFSESGSTPVTLGLAAEVSRMSERALQRRLAESGTTFRELYAQAMATSAKRHLDNATMPIAEIAALHGYDASHFIRAFRRVTGVTPGRYRELSHPTPLEA